MDQRLTPHLMWRRSVLGRYRAAFSDAHLRWAVPASVLIFICSIFIYYFSARYATLHASNPVTDIILSNIPTYNVGYVFVWGAVVLTATIVALNLVHPRRIPFTLYSLSSFFVIRGIFTMMTHIGTPSTMAVLNSSWGFANRFFSGGDLFFSGHTGVPFLMALMFWHKPPLRIGFLATSVFLGIVALLGHLHYTIDVLSAFFITYSIYHIVRWLFPKERLYFMSDDIETELAREFSASPNIATDQVFKKTNFSSAKTELCTSSKENFL